MLILRNFNYTSGLIIGYEETTFKDLMDLGKIVKYNGDIFEWVIYTHGPKPYDYTLTYSQISNNFIKNFNIDEEISIYDTKQYNEGPKCECGKEKHGFTSHSYWCKIK